METQSHGLPPGTVAVLWMMVILEIVSPIPAFLSFGTMYVLVAKPPWFRDLVLDLYAER